VAEERLIGEPPAQMSGFRGVKKKRVPGKGWQPGVRTGNSDEQARQVMALVDMATTDMAQVMRRAGKTSRVPLEACVAEAPDAAKEAALQARLQVAAESMVVVDVALPPLAPNNLTRLMFDMGRAAVRLEPKVRGFAGCLIALALEYIVAGGTITTATLFVNFEPHARATTAMKEADTRQAGFADTVLHPLHVLLECLTSLDVLTRWNNTMGEGPEADVGYAAVDGRQGVLYTLWRFFNLEGDQLRRCVDRYERLQPPLACASRTVRKQSQASAAPNPLWKLA